MILLVEDESRWANRFTKAVAKVCDLEVRTYSRADDLLTAIADDGDGEVRVVCFDQDLASEGRGSELLKVVRTRHGSDPILLGVSSSTDPDDVDRFAEAGADGMASKGALRNGLGEALAKLHDGQLLSKADAGLFENPAGFVDARLVESG